MQKITPFLWFNDNAEEAMNFYVKLFNNSKILSVSSYDNAGPEQKDTVLVGKFVLNGQEFMALNGGPMFKFTEAVSFVINCDTQEEIDYYWDKLSDGGEIQMCGWLKDKFGLSWQVVPSMMDKLMVSKDPEKSKRVMEALMQMKKLDIKTLEEA